MKKEKQKKLDELEERRQRYEKMKKLEDDAAVRIRGMDAWMHGARSVAGHPFFDMQL